MALHYDLRDVKDWKKLAEEQPGTLQSVVFACMFVGIPVITDETFETFMKRLRAYEMSLGHITSSGAFIQPDQVRPFIGIRTNSSKMTDAKYRSHLATIIERRAEDSLEGRTLF